MKHLLYATLALFLVSQYSCANFDCIFGEQAIETRTLSLDAIRGVELNIAAQVKLSEGSTQSVEVTGPADALNVLDVQVVDGICRIDSRQCLNLSQDIQVVMTIPELTYVKINGSGDVTTDVPFANNTQKLDIIIKGSGDAVIAANANDAYLEISGSGDIAWTAGNVGFVETRINGSGDIKLDATCNTLQTNINGSGNLEAGSAMIETANIDINGSGDAYVRVNQTLNVSIKGSGSVYYFGSPGVNASIMGSGEVQQR